MNIKFGKSLQIYYGLTLFILMTLIGIGGYLYWLKGPSNMEYVSMTFEAFYKMDRMKSEAKIKELKSLIRSDRSKEALVLLNMLDDDVQSLNLIQEVDSYHSLRKSIRTGKNELEKLNSSATATSITQALMHKLSSFSSYVEQNQWRTLSRISRRLRSRLNAESKDFSYRKISRLVSEMRKDISTMESVTLSSVLSIGDKANIVSKLKSFETEMKLFTVYLSRIKKHEVTIKKLDKDFNRWIKSVSPEINLKRSEFEKNSQVLLYSFLGLIVLIFTFFLGGFFLYQFSQKKTEEETEGFLVKAIKEGIIAPEVRKKIKLSPEKNEEFLRYRKYVQRRMNFGGIFQEGMPFSSILLDSNLKLTWGNSQFFSDWKVEENHHSEDSLTWDYLQKFTNLGEDDPIFEAAENSVAGIYQVQVKMGANDQMVPYEMYVSPVEISNTKNILIIFYPLNSLEETLANQTRSIVGPILRTLNLMTQNKFSSEEKELVEKDFHIAEITNVFEKFEQLDDAIHLERNILSEKLENLESKICDNHKAMSDVDNHLNSIHLNSTSTYENFEKSKDNIISMIDLRTMMEQLFFEILKVTKNMAKEKESLLLYSAKTQENLIEGTRAFDKIFNLRTSFKEIKRRIEEYRTRLIHDVDQMLTQIKGGGSIENLENSLCRYKMELKSFSDNLTEMGKLMTSFDVSFSKVELIMQEREDVDFSDLKRVFARGQERLEDCSFEYNKYIERGQHLDNSIVSSLEDLFESFKKSRSNAHSASEVVSSSHEHPLS